MCTPDRRTLALLPYPLRQFFVDRSPVIEGHEANGSSLMIGGVNDPKSTNSIFPGTFQFSAEWFATAMRWTVLRPHVERTVNEGSLKSGRECSHALHTRVRSRREERAGGRPEESLERGCSCPGYSVPDGLSQSPPLHRRAPPGSPRLHDA